MKATLLAALLALTLHERSAPACTVVSLPARSYFHATPTAFLALAESSSSVRVLRVLRGQVPVRVFLPWVLLHSMDCGGPDALKEGRVYLVAVRCSPEDYDSEVGYFCPTVCRAAEHAADKLRFLEGHPLVTRGILSSVIEQWQAGQLSTRDFAALVRYLAESADVDDWLPTDPESLFSASLTDALLSALAHAAPALTYSSELASFFRRTLCADFLNALRTPPEDTDAEIENLALSIDSLGDDFALFIPSNDPCFQEHLDRLPPTTSFKPSLVSDLPFR